MNRQLIEKLVLKALKEQKEFPTSLIDKLIRIIQNEKARGYEKDN